MTPGATGPKRATTDDDDSSQAKKRKLGLPSSSNGQTRGDRIAKLAPKKSSFEGDLEQLSQGITELKGGPLCLLHTRCSLHIIQKIKTDPYFEYQQMRKLISIGIDLRWLPSILTGIN